ncbi:penicillin-binding protein 1A [Sphingomonas sp. LaA6.9]|uniref:penicillin-binding protein 1A n=1 Tax=Sphingomonas sp. LaA6.9 TaxID=2919914 RepID=UPI001F5006DC|nr:transglycosylase domain-containing protein [Sphingomonas sp. LaA6.9]MCJ8156721.1 transglycosylase domain-containing protein [Sphingomonas sp. LaA6.9]
MTEAVPENFSYRLKREASGVLDRLRPWWNKRWVRILAYMALAGLLGLLLIWAIFARSLPSADTLLTYEPPLPTNVRAIDGAPVHSYARERRVQLSFDEYPPLLVRSYLAAEDRTFFEHGGLDYPGIIAAIFTNLTNSGRPVGASTITQQVAKNLLLTNELSYVRKIKEAFLAKRIESVLSKEQIMELYLNQIALGRNSFGVQAAARAYFDKDVDALELHEMAFLAILPKAPSTYSRAANVDKAIVRRNWVLGEMRRNGFIDEGQMHAAQAQPLGLLPYVGRREQRVGGYFIEEVRRQLIEKFGESDEGGKNRNSVYSGGLWVRSSLNPAMQESMTEALRAGLIRYDRGKGWSGPINKKPIEVGEGWNRNLLATNIGIGYHDWQAAVVLSKTAGSAELGFANGNRGTLPAGNAQMPRRGTATSAFQAMKPGDIIAVEEQGGVYALRNIPEISGGMVAQNPHTGQVLAMQGGFDSRLQSYNRATQAERQPGSTFKPIAYSAALDSGMTPASIIVDGPFCVYQGARLGQKCFRNFDNKSGAGPQTMRWGLEQSRNLMTVRAASQTGMDKVVKTAAAMGVSLPGKNYPAVLAIALGAGDTTVMRLTNAYSILANNGKALSPTLIDYVQDRHGKVIFKADTRPCERCNMKDWDGKAMPRPALRRKQAVDPMTAYQMVHILEGVIQRGTATVLRDLNRPLFGKTGTSSGPTNVWFVGGSADLVAGVYMGFDQPRPMGGYAQGGTLAAPIFKQFAQKAMKDMPVVPFRAPEGVRMVRIDRKSGRKVFGAWPTDDPKAAVIWEAFKPESEPRRSIRREEVAQAKRADDRAAGAGSAVAHPASDSEFLQSQDGIY